MCGHAVIALARYAVERGLVAAREPETVVRIQCPCGLVTARAEVKDGRAGRVGFASVPAFAFARDAVVVSRRLRARSRWTWAMAGRSTACWPRPSSASTWRPARSAGSWSAAMQLKAAAAAQLAFDAPRQPRPRLSLRHHPDRRRQTAPPRPAATSACSRTARSTAARPAPASPPGWRCCIGAGRVGGRREPAVRQRHGCRIHRPGGRGHPRRAAPGRDRRGRRRGLLHRRGAASGTSPGTGWAGASCCAAEPEPGHGRAVARRCQEGP